MTASELEKALDKVDKYFFTSEIGLNLTLKDFKDLKARRFTNLTTRQFTAELQAVADYVTDCKPNMPKQQMFFLAMSRLDKANRRVGQ